MPEYAPLVLPSMMMRPSGRTKRHQLTLTAPMIP
nr:MAG TPA: hypothetical protein [Caudoviricetes sp.]